MIEKARVIMQQTAYESLIRHLLPIGIAYEEAAFGFATSKTLDDCLTFELVELLPVPPEGFVDRSRYFLHLTDEMRARVIKRAHDLNSSLIEFHSHPLQQDAEFSPSDHSGFDEFVPHVKWRLKGRPYAAFVFTPCSFDALVWTHGGETPIGLCAIDVGDNEYQPTGLTYSSRTRGANDY